MKILFLLIFSFSILNGFSQIQDRYSYWDSGFCSKTIYLNLNGTFYYETGCEGNSAICKGIYSIKDSILYFKIDTSVNGKLNPEIKSTFKNPYDSIYIQVVDCTRKPLNNFRIALLPLPTNKATFTSEMMETNESGMIAFKRKKFTHFIHQNVIEVTPEIEFPWIKIEQDKNFYTIQFNYPFFCLQYNQIEIYSSALGPLTIQGEKLHDKKSKIVFSKN